MANSPRGTQLKSKGQRKRLDREDKSGHMQENLMHISGCVMQGNREGLRKFKLKIESPPRREHIVFCGGSVLADIMRSQDDFWISREEWQEDPHRALQKSVRL